MKVKYLGESDPLELLQNKTYNVIEVDTESGWYRIVDETGDDFLFPPEDFSVIDQPSTTNNDSVYKEINGGF